MNDNISTLKHMQSELKNIANDLAKIEESLKSNQGEQIIIDGLGIYEMRNGLMASIYKENQLYGSLKSFKFHGFYSNKNGYAHDVWAVNGRISRHGVSEFDIVKKIEDIQS